MSEAPKRRRVIGGVIAAMSVFVVACSSSGTSATLPTAATTTTPTTTGTTDTFSGTVGQMGTTGIPFAVSNTGSVSIGLTTVAPLATMALGVGVTTWDGTTCAATPLSKNDNARSGVTALSGTATAGNYCVTVYDSGNIPDGWTVQFSVQVVHP